MFRVKDLFILFGALKHIPERFFTTNYMFLMSIPIESIEYLDHHGVFINLLLSQQRFSLHCFYLETYWCILQEDYSISMIIVTYSFF